MTIQIKANKKHTLNIKDPLDITSYITDDNNKVVAIHYKGAYLDIFPLDKEEFLKLCEHLK